MMGLMMIFWTSPVYASSPTYQIVIDEHNYNLEYEIDANVIAMAIDQELNSLLIGIENAQNSLFKIELPTEMISAENNEFAVLVDGYEVDYQIISKESSNIISFFIPVGSQEVEIIGTHVIPEFPLGITIGFVLILISSVLISKMNSIQIRW